ncbi:MAG: transmembrane 9 family protein [Methanosarcinales archaeon]|nr:MAG: transmembrane 9 family protein [Methanosarcinales archaeon]
MPSLATCLRACTRCSRARRGSATPRSLPLLSQVRSSYARAPRLPARRRAYTAQAFYPCDSLLPSCHPRTRTAGTVYSVGFVLNIFLWYKGSSMAVPFTTLLALFALWFGISVPLVFLGSYLGFKAPEFKHPVRVNNIPRQVPPQPWYLKAAPAVLVGGILPFGAIFVDLFSIMSSIWLGQVRAPSTDCLTLCCLGACGEPDAWRCLGVPRMRGPGGCSRFDTRAELPCG